MNYAIISASTLLVSLTGLLIHIESAPDPIRKEITVDDSGLSDGSTRLARARLADSILPLNRFIKEQRKLCNHTPERAQSWRLLAEALLERARTHGQNQGMEVGRPVFALLPEAMATDLAEGVCAIEHARKLQTEGAELLRIEAELLVAQITGISTAIQHSARISELICRAKSLDPGNARLQVAIGCRKLFAPRFLGHDAEAAKAHLLAAAAGLRLDERPLLLAAMACHLLGEHGQARKLLGKAAKRNPNNRFVAAVIERMDVGEGEPFAKDLEPR